MATQREVIAAFMKSLDTTEASGVTALNNAIKACSSFKSSQEVIYRLISDCKSATSVDEFLQKNAALSLITRTRAR